MTYNIHPIFVHFPIALLFLYSFIKIFPFEKWFPKVSWKHIEIMLLVVGVLGAFVALSTGETASHLIHPSRQLVRMHSLFASISTLLYGVLLFGEIFPFLTDFIIPKLKFPKTTGYVLYIQKILISSLVSKALAFLGFVAISVTGILGGAMVYNTSADPFTGVILKLLGI